MRPIAPTLLVELRPSLYIHLHPQTSKRTPSIINAHFDPTGNRAPTPTCGFHSLFFNTFWLFPK